MPRKTYPRPGYSATGLAFLPGKPPRLNDSVEVAKIPRRVSKRHFAGQKFCGRTERSSGGSSIDVVWIDDPALAQVEPLIEPYRGADFDGMRDLKTYRDAVVVGDDGTIERVRYGADVIFRKREATVEARAQVLTWLSDELGEPIEELKLYAVSSLRERDALAHESVRDDDSRRSGEFLGTRPPLEFQTRSER